MCLPPPADEDVGEAEGASEAVGEEQSVEDGAVVPTDPPLTSEDPDGGGDVVTTDGDPTTTTDSTTTSDEGGAGDANEPSADADDAVVPDPDASTDAVATEESPDAADPTTLLPMQSDDVTGTGTDESTGGPADDVAPLEAAVQLDSDVDGVAGDESADVAVMPGVDSSAQTTTPEVGSRSANGTPSDSRATEGTYVCHDHRMATRPTSCLLKYRGSLNARTHTHISAFRCWHVRP